MGGYIALEMVRQAPARVARLALLDTTARPDTPEQSERRARLIDMAERGQFSGIAELMIPAFLHKAHQQDPELRRIIKVMADETGPQAFVRQQQAIMTRPDSRRCCRRFAARPWCWSGTATSSPRRRCRRRLPPAFPVPASSRCPIAGISRRWSGRTR